MRTAAILMTGLALTGAACSDDGDAPAPDAGCATCSDGGPGASDAAPDAASDAADASLPPPPACSDPKLVGFHVTPTGSPSGDGSLGKPWDLQTALSSNVPVGSVIWLHGGTYKGAFDSTLAGTATSPIVVRQCRGQRATVDGNMTIEGSYTWFWGFEVTNTTHAVNDLQNVTAFCPGVHFIDMISHDATGNGFGIWAEAPDAEAYGNIIYNNGIRGSTCTDPKDFRTCSHGHGIYTQNETGKKRLEDNVLFNQFGYNIHVYGSEAAFLDHYTIDGNVSFDAGGAGGSGDDILVGGGAVVHDLTLTNNMTFDRDGTTASIGYEFGPKNASATVTGNYFVGLVYVDWWDGMAFTQNSLIDGANQLLALQLMNGQSASGYTWDDNVYSYRGAYSPFSIDVNGTTTGDDFAAWKTATGKDGKSTFSSAAPTGVKVFVRPNRYESGRANVVIYNWDEAAMVPVDVSGVLQKGDSYELRDVQDYFGAPVLTGTYDGAPLAVPMKATQPPTPVEGWNGVTPPVTGPTFGVFVLSLEGS